MILSRRVAFVFAVLVSINFASNRATSNAYGQDRETQKQLLELQRRLNEPGDSKTPTARKEYLGRKIAQTMHYTGAEWLIRNRREREERCSLMLANLGVKRGQTICDMGCGNGFHTLALAKMTGENGVVIGVDVQPQMLLMLRKRMEEQGIENITPILGSYHSPRLPPKSIDLVLMVDVYHEFSHPELMLKSIRNSLNPGGQIVLLEYREEDPDVPIKPLHKMSKAQVDKEMRANGFKLIRSFDKLPWQHMLFYGVDENWNANDKAKVSDANAEPTTDATKDESGAH